MAVTGVLGLGGGIAAANQLVLHALHDMGYSVDILALNEETASPHLEAVTHRGFNNRKRAFVSAIFRSVLTRNYSFVFCDHVNLAMSLLPLQKIGIARTIVRLNGIEVFPDYLNQKGRLGLRAASHLTASSDFTRQEVEKQFPQYQITTVDLSLSPTDSQAAMTLPVADTLPMRLEAVNGSLQWIGQQMLLIVGRMSANERYKGHDVLIQSMPLILDAHPDAQLVLAGSGDDFDRIRELARTLPEQAQRAIFMPGFVSSEMLKSLYQHCYCFVMPSRGEGFGLVYLEAMRWAKPCLGSSVDSAQCIIRNGETGILVSEPGKPDAVADALIRLLYTPEAAQHMGQAGYLLLKQRYLYPHFRERFMSFLGSTVGHE